MPDRAMPAAQKDTLAPWAIRMCRTVRPGMSGPVLACRVAPCPMRFRTQNSLATAFQRPRARSGSGSRGGHRAAEAANGGPGSGPRTGGTPGPRTRTGAHRAAPDDRPGPPRPASPGADGRPEVPGRRAPAPVRQQAIVRSRPAPLGSARAAGAASSQAAGFGAERRARTSQAPGTSSVAVAGPPRPLETPSAGAGGLG